MATQTKARRVLSEEQLEELLALTRKADSVELKLTVPDGNQRSAVSALDMDPLDAQIRQVFFFDTPDLRLDAAGVVVRARRVQGRGPDTVVKLRPIDPDAVSAGVRKLPGFGIEVDAMPGGFVCSGSLKARSDRDRVRAVAGGDRPIRKLFTKEQRKLYADHAPDGLELDDLAVLGPIPVLKLKFVPTGGLRPLVAELWLYPDGARILELSTKCRPDEAFQVAAEERAFLSSRGVDLGGVQQTKTRTALEFFAGELKAEAP
jgi:hypothetical protein